MLVDAELIILPYSARDGRDLLDRLIDELNSSEWTEFRAAVAFASWTGNFPDLLEALHRFVDRGNEATLTFSAQEFGSGSYASDLQAIEGLLDRLNAFPNAHLHLYREPGRTFHPKIYLFSNEERALLILGSSNWGEGGFVRNIEANVALTLDLQDGDTLREYRRLVGYFERYWTPGGRDG